MRRGWVMGVLLAVGGLSAVTAAYQAQQQAAPKVVEVEKLKDNLFLLKGGGGNTAVFVTASGVVVVDTKNPGWGQPILDKIKDRSRAGVAAPDAAPDAAPGAEPDAERVQE